MESGAGFATDSGELWVPTSTSIGLTFFLLKTDKDIKINLNYRKIRIVPAGFPEQERGFAIVLGLRPDDVKMEGTLRMVQ